MPPQSDEMCSLSNAYNTYSILIILIKDKRSPGRCLFTVLLRPVS